MTKRIVLCVAAVGALVGCVPTAASTSSPPPTPSSASATPSPSPSPSPSLLSDEELPLAFPVSGSLLADADRVVERLHEAAGGLPVLRVDLRMDQATLTALLPDHQVVSYRWHGDEITHVPSDIQYLDQTTFDPADYPLDSAERMFDIADLKGVRGELVLQIVEYRAGEVAITITSRPESDTVFFRDDGSAVNSLGITSVADISSGLGEVLGERTEAYAVGFDDTRGYWADLPDAEAGVVLTRARVGSVPVFETRRSETPTLAVFDPSTIQPATIAKAIANYQSDDEPCSVTVDMSLERSAPVVRVECDGTVWYSDLEGRDMTALID